jgi:hypothetical protein
MENINEIGFNIGWDHAQYGVTLPENANTGIILDGYNAGLLKLNNTRPKPSNRYIKKWLQLRRNAFKRRRLFDEEVTPDYIKDIDVKYCPVCRFELTHGTSSDTDWSIDRLDNNGGYVRGNLVVMSSRANMAKNDLTIDNMETINTDSYKHSVLIDERNSRRLTEEESIRLYTLTLIPTPGKILLPAAVSIPKYVPSNPIYALQSYLTRLCVVGSLIPSVKKKIKTIDPSPTGLNSVIRLIMSQVKPKFAAKLKESVDKKLLGDITFDSRLVFTIAEDVWLNNDLLYDAFKKWLVKTPENIFLRAVEKTCNIAYNEQCSNTPFSGVANTNDSEYASYINHIRGEEGNGYI